MRRFLFVLIAGFVIFLALFVNAQKADAQLASCDQCGYCVRPTSVPGQPPVPTLPIPGTWKSCAKCLYPGLGDDPNPQSNETLRISSTDPNAFTDVIPTVRPGHYFLSLANICVRTGGFTSASAPGAFAQIILNTIFSIAGIIAFLYILFGAYQIATAQSNPEKINYGKRLIVGSIIGLVVSLSAIFLINLIAGQILKIPGFG